MIVKPDPTIAAYGCPRFPGKYCYRSFEIAATAASKRRRSTGDVGIRAYRCRGHFHMGHLR